MNIAAFVVGLIIGLIVFWRSIGILMMVLVFLPFMSKDKFNAIYDTVDDEASYELYGQKLAKSYSEYLSLHKIANSEDHSYKRFRYHHINSIKYLLTRVLPFALLPAILFWVNWYWYLIGVLASMLILAFYNRLVKRMSISFYQRAVIFMVIEGFVEDINKPRRALKG